MTTVESRPPSPEDTATTIKSRAGTAGCCARRIRASSAAGATTSTTSRCPACCTWRSCARRLRTPASSSIDTTAAQAHPKVKAVVTGRRSGREGSGVDADAVQRRPGRAGHRQGALPGPGGRVRRRRGPLFGPRRARADRRRVRPVGPGRRRAQSARSRRSGDPRRPRRARPTTTCFDWETGDAAATEAVFAGADVVVKQEIVYPRVHPAPMETCGAVADFDPVTGKLTLWTTSQAPHAHRTLYALVAGLPEHKIRVISPDIGGGFGNKVPIYPGYVCAIVGSLVLGKPVKWMEDRSENLTSARASRATTSWSARSPPLGRQDPGDPVQRARRPRRVQRPSARRPSTRRVSSGCSPAATTSRPRTVT